MEDEGLAAVAAELAARGELRSRPPSFSSTSGRPRLERSRDRHGERVDLVWPGRAMSIGTSWRGDAI